MTVDDTCPAHLWRAALMASATPMIIYRFEDLEDPGSVRQLACNDAACEVVQRDLYPHNGKTWREDSPELVQSRFGPIFRRVAESGEPEIYEIQYGDSEYKYAVWRGRATRIDDRVLLIAFQDCSEEVELERLREEHSAKIVQAHESERRALAAELHDGIAQEIAALGLYSEMMQRESPGPRATKLNTGLIRVVAELRQLSYGLHPLELSQHGLLGAIREFVHRTTAVHSDVRVLVHSSIADRDSFGDQHDIAIYRIVQESVGNALRHGRPTLVTITLESDADRIMGSVVDDGDGFDADTLTNGLGLPSMQERSRLLHGTLTIESRPRATATQHGTAVRFTIPLSEATDAND